MLKIGQNWVKLQIIPPNAQQRSAPVHADNRSKLIQKLLAKILRIEVCNCIIT